MAELIRLSLTQVEGMMIGAFIDGAIEKVESASIEERQDADIQAMYEMCKRIRPYLPKVNK